MGTTAVHRVLAAGTAEADRVELLIRFSLPCSGCLESLEKVALEPWPATNVDDPFSLALGRWLELLRDSPELAGRIARLRPAHIWWIHHFRGRLLGFARLVVEESRQRSLERPQLARRLSREVDKALHDPRFAAAVGSSEAGKRTLHDLLGLARAYHADACRAAGDLTEARYLFSISESTIDRGTHDDEIRATLCELSFRMAWMRRHEDHADGLLFRAERILSRSPVRVQGRLAETWILQGWRRLQTDPRSALPLFRRALTELPDGASPGLRYLALHWSAAAAHFDGNPRAARRFLREAEAVELPYPMPVQQAQDQWLRGRLELASKRWRLSDAALRGAMEAFRRLGSTLDALSVAMDLFELCLLRGRPQDLEGLAEELRGLLGSPEAKLMTCLELQPVIVLASSLGVSTRSLSKLYAELVFEVGAEEFQLTRWSSSLGISARIFRDQPSSQR